MTYGNRSLDFLEMIKNNSAKSSSESKTAAKKNMTGNYDEKPEMTEIKKEIKKELEIEAKHIDCSSDKIAVIDTETNWDNEVMSIGVAVADAEDYKCVDKKYYILEREAWAGGMYDNVLHAQSGVKEIVTDRKTAMEDLKTYLQNHGVKRIFAYNAKFDYGHLKELSGYYWYDIMRLAAYRQYNSGIPESADCCKTGRLKTGYGVEGITRMLTGNRSYMEVHNAVCDAVDELRIMELLGHPIETYECAKL